MQLILLLGLYSEASLIDHCALSCAQYALLFLTWLFKVDCHMMHPKPADMKTGFHGPMLFHKKIAAYQMCSLSCTNLLFIHLA
jgi:hypothetical protein